LVNCLSKQYCINKERALHNHEKKPVPEPTWFSNTLGYILTSVWSLLEAANTIACDFIPRIAAGFKLQSTQTLRFCFIQHIVWG
jgi:hypothetical protein